MNAWNRSVGALALAVIGPLVLAGEVRAVPPFAPRDIEAIRSDAAEAERLGWSSEGLDKVLDRVARSSSDAFAIVTDGRVVAAMGDLSEIHPLHSIRKSLLSALVGLHSGPDPQQIPLDATLAGIAIDDTPQLLTDLQKQATVRHLLKSVSGINHRTAAEGGLSADKNRRLGFGENRPGEIWAYNNWDYNALTTIFEDRTGLTVAQAFMAGIAGPTGMRDMTAEWVSYRAAPELSRHRAAMFRMSARDLVRFGELYLEDGEANGVRVLPEGWTSLPAADYTETGIGGLRNGHGYLWWIPAESTGLPPGTFFAWGLGQQALFVVPEWNTVIVHLADTTQFIKRFIALQRDGVGGDEAVERLILECLEPAARSTDFCIEHRFTTRREFSSLVAAIAEARLGENLPSGGE